MVWDLRFSAKAVAGHLVVTVADRGYGIPVEDIERIFEKFYRVPRLEDADIPGTGLGLAFVREIVELHGGSVFAPVSYTHLTLPTILRV